VSLAHDCVTDQSAEEETKPVIRHIWNSVWRVEQKYYWDVIPDIVVFWNAGR